METEIKIMIIYSYRKRTSTNYFHFLSLILFFNLLLNLFEFPDIFLRVEMDINEKLLDLH